MRKFPLAVPVARAEMARLQVDQLVRDGKTPGIQYRVVSAERTVFAHAAGFADVAARRPMDSRTTLMAYSMSKTFTAVAVLQLAGAGKLALDDALSTSIAWHPYGREVTVRQLLSHTGG